MIARLDIPLPLTQREIGLGTLLSNLFSKVGVRPCGGCQARRAWLDQRVSLVPRGVDENPIHNFDPTLR